MNADPIPVDHRFLAGEVKAMAREAGALNPSGVQHHLRRVIEHYRARGYTAEADSLARELPPSMRS